MTVVAFPDEIIRRFLERLEESPRFSSYLEALIYCARKQLDPGSLHQWWKSNAHRIEFDDLELDFVDFLNTIIVSHETWEAAKQRIQDRLSRTKPDADESEIAASARKLMDLALADISRRRSFIEEHPEYRCVESAERWHQVFEGLFGANDPLRIMARWCAQLLPCGLPTSSTEGAYSCGESPAGSFGCEDERPPAFLIGSPEHAHLLEVSAWIAERLERPQLQRVVDWSLNNEWMETPPAAIFEAVRHCSHALFTHLMLYKEVQPADPDSLIYLLELPLALSASASGPPHLLPEFGFLGAGMDPDSETYHMKRVVGRDDLTVAWRRFFAAYTRLRLRGNGSRGFPRADKLYLIALTLFRGNDLCWTDEEERDCIAESIRLMKPDITCLLGYFLDAFVNFTDPWEEEAEVDDVTTARTFPGTNAFVPVAAALREESLHELASAVLSYYLVISAVVAKGNLDEMTGLDEALSTSRGLPGHHLIETTLRFICAFADENGHPLTRMKFEQFLMPADQRVQALLSAGESETCEFKSTLRTNLHTGQADRSIEHAALKSVAAFLNKRGGSLLIGVADSGEILGLEADRFPNTDKLILHLKNLIKDTMPEALDLIQMSVVSAGGRSLLLVECERGQQPVYLKNRRSKDEEFYVRRGPSTDRLGMREAFDYIQRNFPEAGPLLSD